MPTIYAADWVLPIDSPMIEGGAVAIDRSNLVAVGTRTEIISRYPGLQVEDFGRAAILPGFINAHSHLELTAMRGFLEAQENDFFSWLRKLTVARLTMQSEDLVVSATCGAIEAARAGITCVGDSSSSGVQTMQALRQVGLRGVVYQESFGPDPNAAAENVARLNGQLNEMRAYENEVVSVGVSPHAAYTVSGPQIELIARLASDQRLPLMMHAAESQAEQLFLRQGLGPFAEGLARRGIEWKAPGISTIAYLERHGVLANRPLLAHCITVDDRDLRIIAQSGAAVAHCPKSNAKLGHGRAPFRRFISAGIKVGLGSDSVASNNTCDLIEEARFATLLTRLDSADTRQTFDKLMEAEDKPKAAISAEQALFAATAGGARALGIDDRVGILKEGMQADIVIVDLGGAHQQPIGSPADALIFSSSGRDVLLTMVAGRVIYRDSRVDTVSEEQLTNRLRDIRTKLEKI
jgi:5-methylthioadenosine/S-adenosylhomocysteine deaminase